MADDKEGGTSTWYKVPTWSGNPMEWRAFRKEMNWWMASLDMESTKKYNVAARWALRQYGVVRARCEEFDPDDLKGTEATTLRDTETGEELVVSEADPLAGLKKLMKALEESVGKTQLDRKGELRQQFYQDMRRGAGERINAYCTRFRTLASELKREGITLPPEELGWFLKDRMGLDAIRRQLLDTALQGKEDYDAVEGEALRLFRDLHSADPLRKPGIGGGGERPPILQRFLSQNSGSYGGRTSLPSSASSHASTFRSFRTSSSNGSQQHRGGPPRRPFQPPRQAMVAEGPDEQEAEDEELIPAEMAEEAGGGGHPSLEEVLQMEAEVLASELQQLEEEGEVEPSMIEDLEAGVEAAAESLVTMREARSRIAEVRKDRGFGKIGGGKGGKSKSRMHGNQTASQKSVTQCWDCGEKGHWAGDDKCGKPGAGLFRPKGKGNSSYSNAKQVKITESLNTEHAVEVADGVTNQDGHEVLACSTRETSLREALKIGRETQAASAPQLSSDKKMVGALDSACNRTCTGEVWLQHYLQSLKDAPAEIQNLIKSVPEKEVFRFGNGGCKHSYVRYRIPMMLGSSLMMVWVSVVDVPSLGLLLGRDFLDAIGAVLSFSKKLLRADLLNTSLIKLQQLVAGHFALRLAPATWTLPGGIRWRRVGQDGIIEVQLSSHDWLQRKLNSHDVCQPRDHEHLVTEQGFRAADLAHSGLMNNTNIDAGSQSLAHAAQKQSGSTSSTASTSSRTSLDGKAELPRRGQSKESDKMVKDGATARTSSGVARSWNALVVAAATISTLCSLSLPQCEHREPVAIAGRPNGSLRSSFEEAPRTWPTTRSLQSFNVGRVVLVSEQDGDPSIVPGRSYADWNDGCSSNERSSIQHEERGSEGSQGCSQAARGRRPSRGGGQINDWTKRWPSNFERRSGKAGFATSHRSLREDDCRSTTSSLSRSDSHHEVRHKAGSDPREHQWKQLAKFPRSEGSRRASNDSYQNDKAFDFTAQLPRKSWVEPSRSAGTSGTTRSEVPWDAQPSVAARDAHADPWLCDATSDVNGPLTSGSDGRSSRRERREDSWLDSIRDRPGQRRLLWNHAGDESQRSVWRPGQHDTGADQGNAGRVVKGDEWKLHQELKTGQAMMIKQAWEKHEKDRKLVSLNPKQAREAMEFVWKKEMEKCMNETFITTIDLTSSTVEAPFMQEIFTATQRVTEEARRRGHLVGPPLSLETGWNFTRELDRRAAYKWVEVNKPYFLMIAYPCGPWSPLMRLNAPHDLQQRQEEGRELIRFALRLARLQRRNGRHFALENPIGSGSWSLPEMVKFLEELEVKIARFDQCRYNLRSEKGMLHRKRTQIATSSGEMKERLDGMDCKKDHLHQPVIGGARITARAGHYPIPLAKALVSGMEDEFHKQFQKKSQNETMAAEDGDGDGDVPSGEDDGDLDAPDDPNQSSEDEYGKDDGSLKISPMVRQAVRRLHENTGHRSNRRLARALVVAGAPPEVVKAARFLKCSVCAERKGPKARRPTSLPVPKDTSDQVHIDIFEAEDVNGVRFYVVHCIDQATRFQMAEVLPNKSSESVINFLKTRWFPIFGPPRVLVADQGREFVSWNFEELCAQHSILLWHCAVQAPWQNGVCERGGGVLKAILGALVKSQSVVGGEDLQVALQEAVTAYNNDITDAGVSPAQAALGRQPRLQGDVLGNFGQRLAEHGLIDSKPSLARQVAMREVARVAMARLHFSRGLRRASLARSRTTTMTQPLEPGMIVYYFRQTKYNSKTGPSKKKLSLKRWHGPALLVANEGHANCFLSHKGQLTKCAREHVRPASTLEQISSDVWHDAIEEVIEAAMNDLQGAQLPPQPIEDRQSQQPSEPASVQQQPSSLPPEDQSQQRPPLSLDQAKRMSLEEQLHHDLPPVGPREFAEAIVGRDEATALSQRSSLPASMLSSRRTSTVSAPGFGGGVRSGSPVPDLIRQASQVPARMEAILEKARTVDGQQGVQSGQKRAAEVPVEELAGQAEPSGASASAGPFDALVLSREEMMKTKDADNVHPLKKIWLECNEDRDQPFEHVVEDRGTWKGYWPLPSRSEWQAVLSIGGMWPRGEQEALAVQTARKEYRWRQLDDAAKAQFREAAGAGWSVWVENQAVQILTASDAARVRERLRSSNQSGRILTPRFVLTDKHDGLRTFSNPLPLKANARLVVPGYQDLTSSQVRCDAPTSSRLSFQLLLTVTACKKWNLLSADVKSAFLKGEEFAPGERELYIENVKTHDADEPRLPLGEGGLAKLKKGIFGLADSPRRWYLRLHRALTELGFQRSYTDAALWFLWSEDRTQLEGMVASHVDDLLVGGNSRTKEKILQLGKQLGFGSLEEKKFVYCGKLIQQHGDGSISVSMKEYHENLKPIPIPLHRRKTPEDGLLPGEQKQLRALLGSLQWLVAQVRFDLGFALCTLQGEQGTVSTMMKANLLLKKFKQKADFALWFHPFELDDVVWLESQMLHWAMFSEMVQQEKTPW